MTRSDPRAEPDRFIKESFMALDNAALARATGLSVYAVEHRLRRLGLNRNAFSKRLEENGFEEGNWDYGWLKTDTASIFIKNEKGLMTYDDVRDELVREMDRHAPKYPSPKRAKVAEPHLLVIDPADVHIGKLALKEESGEDYGIEEAKRRCIEGVSGILDKAKGFPVERILLVIGNDVIHTDNMFRTTTSGTKQDTDGQWWQMFREAKSMYVSIIERLMAVADVHVVYCPSNHDHMTGYMLADTLKSWFRNAKGVTFDADPSHRKYWQYGLNMLCFDHGDGAKERDAKDLMADERPRMWADTKYRYSYKHHIHSKRKLNWLSGKDYIGVTVEYLRSPSAADAWHAKSGYVSPKAVEGFVHSRERGQVARLTHYF